MHFVSMVRFLGCLMIDIFTLPCSGVKCQILCTHILIRVHSSIHMYYTGTNVDKIFDAIAQKLPKHQAPQGTDGIQIIHDDSYENGRRCC